MKNIFKFMGIALIASSMVLVGCQKDNTNDTNNTTNNNNTNQQEETYKLTLKVNDNAMGTVTANPQKESYKKGDTVVLTATANQGFEFVNWSDGVTDNPRTVTVTENKTYTANFVVYVPDHANVSYANTDWVASTIGCGTSGSSFITLLYQDYQNRATTPHVYINGGKTTGEFVMSNSNNYGWFYFNYEEDFTLDEGEEYPTWQPASFTQNITAIDMNAHTFTFTAEGSVFNLAEYNEDTTENHTNTTINTLAVDVKGEWQAVTFNGKKIVF